MKIIKALLSVLCIESIVLLLWFFGSNVAPSLALGFINLIILFVLVVSVMLYSQKLSRWSLFSLFLLLAISSFVMILLALFDVTKPYGITYNGLVGTIFSLLSLLILSLYKFRSEKIKNVFFLLTFSILACLFLSFHVNLVTSLYMLPLGFFVVDPMLVYSYTLLHLLISFSAFIFLIIIVSVIIDLVVGKKAALKSLDDNNIALGSVFLWIIICLIGSVFIYENYNLINQISQYNNYYNSEQSFPLQIQNEQSFPIQTEKPVIYLYPTQKEQVSVKLNFPGKVISTYPQYTNTGWNVEAYPDGTLINDADNQTYNYLFWEGETSNLNFNMSKGFIVTGNETASFLQNELKQMGLTPSEYNNFITYWLPQMSNNKYNLIHFATQSEYADKVALNITPKPDSVLRIFMVFKPLNSNNNINATPQSFQTFQRKGFSVVEWGGSKE